MNAIVALSNTCLMVCKILTIGYQLGTPDHIVYELLALRENISDCYRSVWAIMQQQPVHILYLIAVCSCTKSQIISSAYSVPHTVHVMMVYSKVLWDYGQGIHNWIKWWPWNVHETIRSSDNDSTGFWPPGSCIPWVQRGTFNKEIGFLCGLRPFALNIYFVGNTYNQVYIWCCKYGKNRYNERCANK